MSAHALKYGDLVRRKESCRAVSEVHSASFDPNQEGVGSTPWVGDMGRTGIRVPTAPTTEQSNRYLFRLCGVEIPSGYAIIIRGLRQLVTIYGTVGVEEPYPFEREVTSPVWTFIDGNISWHLRWQTNQFAPISSDASQAPGTSPEMRGLDTALLYTAPGSVPYIAAASGLPPGNGIASYGTFTDLRFPWRNNHWAMGELIVGAGAVVLYASVKQTDPDTRPTPPEVSVSGVSDEDVFVQNVTNARYGLIGGAIIYELFPCCGKLKTGARGLHNDSRR